MSEQILKTSEEWNREEPGLIILDYDGWDRQNLEYSFYEEKITKDEYNKRLGRSTIQLNVSY